MFTPKFKDEFRLFTLVFYISIAVFVLFAAVTYVGLGITPPQAQPSEGIALSFVYAITPVIAAILIWYVFALIVDLLIKFKIRYWVRGAVILPALLYTIVYSSYFITSTASQSNIELKDHSLTGIVGSVIIWAILGSIIGLIAGFIIKRKNQK